MISNSLRTRGVHFAFLFGPPRTVEREEAYRIHAAVCESLHLDDLAFKFSTSESGASPSSKGYAITFERKEGRGSFSALIDNPGIQQPIRLLIRYDWPPSPTHVAERCNMTAKAVLDTLGGNLQKVLAETRIRAQCDVREQSGLRYIRDNVLRLNPTWVDSLGNPLMFVSVKFKVAASNQSSEPLENPARELTIEVLQEDPKCLYLELMSQWPQIAPPAGPGGGFDAASIRPITEPPEVYIEEAYQFLSRRITELAQEGKPRA
ncbi:MAG: hypothetical protein ACUVXJ_15155 [Phycisphaerae bacterium]